MYVAGYAVATLKDINLSDDIQLQGAPTSHGLSSFCLQITGIPTVTSRFPSHPIVVEYQQC